MRDGSWTIEPCEYAEVKALAEALELGEITASILVRRGYADVEEARRFVRGEIEPHDPLLLGDMAVAVEKIRAAIAAGRADLRPRRLRRRRDLRHRRSPC